MKKILLVFSIFFLSVLYVNEAVKINNLVKEISTKEENQDEKSKFYKKISETDMEFVYILFLKNNI